MNVLISDNSCINQSQPVQNCEYPPENAEKFNGFSELAIKLVRIWKRTIAFIVTIYMQVEEFKRLCFTLIFKGKKAAIRLIHRNLKNEMAKDSVNILNATDLDLIKEKLKPGDLIFTVKGPSYGGNHILWGQWLAKPFLNNNHTTLASHSFTHSATFVNDEEGQNWIAEATVDDNGKVVRSIPLEHQHFKLNATDDCFYKVIRLKDQRMAEKLNELTLKFAPPVTDDTTRSSAFKYGYKKALVSLLLPSHFDRRVRKEMLIAAAFSKMPKPENGDKYTGDIYCSMFTGWTLLAANGQVVIEDLQEKFPDDPLLHYPEFGEAKPAKAFRKWAKEILKKYDDQINKMSIFRFDPLLLTPQKLSTELMNSDENFETKYAIIPGNHPALDLI